ncbi:MAG: hypothetical protein CMB99_07045 [Flavobacteriaceae bacterium]|nr:hypothetical protein [Flavobacteriaceae bacterium]|tara:strand:- start:20703 stop:21971 length:1269 start_codon:yes stop_codon:yes gene_type:complete
MKEEFLHFVWKQKVLLSNQIYTTQKELVRILEPGFYNNNSGPDFLYAKIRIGNTLWAGHVEIHLKSSDWYAHRHQQDDNYDPVILHVVWEDDVPVYSNDNVPFPTLVVKDYLEDQLFLNYQKLIDNQNWIACGDGIADVDSFVFNHWLERLFFERLERKAMQIERWLQETNNDFEAVLFMVLAKNFGLKVNGEAFCQLAQSIDFSVIKKVASSSFSLEALLFGQAGFLSETIDVPYHHELREAYSFLMKKYQLKPGRKTKFQFFRMRPQNFPTIRIAQLAALYSSQSNLFSKLMNCRTKNEYYQVLDLQLNSFWRTHYNFEKLSKASTKNLSKSFKQLLLINAILPMKWLYGKYSNSSSVNEIIALLEDLPAEQNGIIKGFQRLDIKARNLKESQALLELKYNYCAKKRCLQCAIGSKLLKQ